MAYPHLPARIPRHFGLGGTADASWATTLGHWMLLLFLILQASTYHVATAGANTLPVTGTLVSIAMPLVLLAAALGLAWWLPRRMRGAEDA